ncbi:MAG: LD-carboxypeptidase [Bacteroidales bacterium]|nr:LD-carboxypeptidase [Bacteroidales bacterium]
MISPQYLKKGDTIGIVSTARKISGNEISAAVKIFEGWGLKVELGKNIFSEHHQFAGTDSQRLIDFQQMLDNPGIKAIVCARGGYGTVKIIDNIDFSSFSKNPKWIAGFSDVTVLHSHILTNFGIETIHSGMPVNFNNIPEDSQSITTLKNALFGEGLSYNINPHPFNRKGRATATLAGGNLSILYSLSGSISDIDTKGKILFIEDLDEYLYHIDRMMMNLKRSGKLKNLAGLIVGSMSEMNDNTTPYGQTAYEIIKECVEEYDYPLCFGFPAGHIKDNRTLIFGRKIHLIIEDIVHLSL